MESHGRVMLSSFTVQDVAYCHKNTYRLQLTEKGTCLLTMESRMEWNTTWLYQTIHALLNKQLLSHGRSRDLCWKDIDIYRRAVFTNMQAHSPIHQLLKIAYTLRWSLKWRSGWRQKQKKDMNVKRVRWSSTWMESEMSSDRNSNARTKDVMKHKEGNWLCQESYR